ncbi:MAG: hypothetical protein MJ114_06050 [Acetatifactor sp.]|nr:hypothetical protein [Acetatifactor sp.]
MEEICGVALPEENASLEEIQKAIAKLRDIVEQNATLESILGLGMLYQEAGNKLYLSQRETAAKAYYIKSTDMATRAVECAENVTHLKILMICQKKVADLNYQLGLTAEAEVGFEETQRTAERMAELEPTMEHYQNLLELYEIIGAINISQKENAKAARYIESCCNILEMMICQGDKEAEEKLQNLKQVLQKLKSE